jgi:sugar O-acyltransferase (sialic acid O-acetyltransferase NeuD family)
VSAYGHLIIGAGGHAKVVADALLAAGVPVLGFVVEKPVVADARLMGLPLFHQERDLPRFDRSLTRLAMGLGGTCGTALDSGRAALSAELLAQGWTFASVRHPAAVVAASAQLGSGVQLLTRAVVQPDAQIGDGSIINTAAVVEHDSIVGRFCHISIGAIMCGNVCVGDGSHVGAGAVVREGISIGNAATIGIGAVVVADCAAGQTYYGNPARQATRK